MASGNGASAPVRPMAETAANGGIPHQPDRVEASSADFTLAVDGALAPLDNMMGPRARAVAIANARREILAAADAAMKAEKRRIVAALTPAQLRKEVRELLDAHEQLLDYIDDLERQPVIAGEVRRLRSSGEIRWVL
jgi:hypothetical protein